MIVRCKNCGSSNVWKCEASESERILVSYDGGETVEEEESTAVFFECDDCGSRWPR